MPLENHPKILLLSPYLNCFLFELNDKTFISFSWLCVCLYASSITVWTRENPSMSSTASKQTRTSSATPNPKDSTSIRTSRKALRTASSIPPFDAYFVPVFINSTYWPVLENCICFACWKHGWIATPWFVITIPWPPRLMSECVVWTLITARKLMTLYTIQLVL